MLSLLLHNALPSVVQVSARGFWDGRAAPESPEALVRAYRACIPCSVRLSAPNLGLAGAAAFLGDSRIVDRSTPLMFHLGDSGELVRIEQDLAEPLGRFSCVRVVFEYERVDVTDGVFLHPIRSWGESDRAPWGYYLPVESRMRSVKSRSLVDLAGNSILLFDSIDMLFDVDRTRNLDDPTDDSFLEQLARNSRTIALWRRVDLLRSELLKYAMNDDE